MSRFENEQVSTRNIVMVLTYVIGLLSLSAAVPHIGVLYTSWFIVMFILAVYREHAKFTIPRFSLTIISIALVIFFILIFDINSFAVQLIEVLLILLGVKLLDEKSVRDHMQIYAISLLLLAALGLLIPTILYALYILLFVVLLSLTFVFLTYYSELPELVLNRRTVATILSRSAWIPMFAIPLSIVMFLILPRSQYPFLNFLNRSDEARTGFTDTVRLGEVTNIQEDTGIIFRASCPRLNVRDVYWRGMTLDYFDGTAWRSTGNTRYGASVMNRRTAAKAVKQTIYLEPYHSSYYFALDKPLEISIKRARTFNDLTIIAPSFIGRRVRYEVTSVLSDTILQETVDRERYLQMPKDVSPRIVLLAKNITLNNSPEENIYRLLRHLNDGQYVYSMHGLPLTQKPLETFLFESRKGNCEYFASALALLLRISNIPSRIVGGYRGGYYNEVGGYYIVPQSNAHVWVEAFVHDKGWIRLDPTPASPDASQKRAILTKLRITFDTINYFWNTIIINYSLEQQIRMSRHFIDALDSPYNFQLHRIKGMSLYIIIGSITIAIILCGVIMFFRKKRSPELYIVLRFLRILERSGYRKKPEQGLEEFISCITDSRLRTQALRFVGEFEKLYYTDKRIGSPDLVLLKSILNEIERCPDANVRSGNS